MHNVIINVRISASRQFLQSHDKVTQSKGHYKCCHNASNRCSYLILALHVEGWDRLPEPVNFTEEAIDMPWRFSERPRILLIFVFLTVIVFMHL